MPITLDEIVEETKHWPPERVGELVGRLTEDLHASDPEIEAAWKTEIDRRIEEIESAKSKAFPVKKSPPASKKFSSGETTYFSSRRG